MAKKKWKDRQKAVDKLAPRFDEFIAEMDVSKPTLDSLKNGSAKMDVSKPTLDSLKNGSAEMDVSKPTLYSLKNGSADKEQLIEYDPVLSYAREMLTKLESYGIQ